MSRTRGLNGPPPTISPAARPRHATRPPGSSSEGVVAFARELAEPAGDLGRHRPLDGATQRPVLQRRRAAFGLEVDARKPADDMALDRHRAVGADAAEDGAGVLVQGPASACWCAGRRSAASATGAACRRAGLPDRGRGPARPADRRASRRGWRYRRACARARARIDRASMSPSARSSVANWPCIQSSGMRRSPLRQVREEGADEPRVLVLRRLAEVGRLADLPQAHQIGAVAGAADDRLVGRELAQRRLVLRFLGKPEPGHRRRARRASA